jgi:hypothetical protein
MTLVTPEISGKIGGKNMESLPSKGRKGRNGSGLSWTKSSLSFSNSNCVEVASMADGGVAVRDSKHPEGSVLCFTASEWDAFVAGVRNGEFDGFGKA